MSTSSDNNASSVVSAGKTLTRFLTIPMSCSQNSRRWLGLPPDRTAGRFILTALPAGSFRQNLPFVKSASTRIPFSAQYDRMGFGRIEILTKPGTDKLHGQVFFNDNHSFIDALNPLPPLSPISAHRWSAATWVGRWERSFPTRSTRSAAILMGYGHITRGICCGKPAGGWRAQPPRAHQCQRAL